MKRPLRILMLLLEYHPIFSGHGIYLQALISRLSKVGCKVSILTSDFHRLPSYEIVDGIEIHRMKFDPADPCWEKKLTYRAGKFLIANVNKFDILHINGHLDIYGLLTILCKFMGKSVISQMVLMGADDPLTLKEQYRFMNLRFRFLSLMDRFLVISKKLGESYQSSGLPMKKLTYIPQGVDINRFCPATASKKAELRQQLGLSRYNKIVIFIGAIIHRKGIDWLIDAWERIGPNHHGDLLLLVGPDNFGPEDVNRDELNAFVAKLKDQVKRHSLSVIFAGRKANVDDYLKSSDVFVLPSRKEGFGNVILEAMASSLPSVITFMDGVSEETISHGFDGLVVHNPDQLAGAIDTLLDDEETAKLYGSNARKKVLSGFSMEAIAERYAECYREVME